MEENIFNKKLLLKKELFFTKLNLIKGGHKSEDVKDKGTKGGCTFSMGKCC